MHCKIAWSILSLCPFFLFPAEGVAAMRLRYNAFPVMFCGPLALQLTGWSYRLADPSTVSHLPCTPTWQHYLYISSKGLYCKIWLYRRVAKAPAYYLYTDRRLQTRTLVQASFSMMTRYPAVYQFYSSCPLRKMGRSYRFHQLASTRKGPLAF